VSVVDPRRCARASRLPRWKYTWRMPGPCLFSEGLLRRFWSRVDKRGPAECWVWRGHVDRDGYGRLNVGSGARYVHRIAWMIRHGFIPPATTVVNRCGTRLCVNVRHLKTVERRDLLDQQGFGRLASYVAREGHSRVHAKHIERGFRLGGWICRIRAAYKKGRLPPKIVARLEALPRWSWNPYRDNFFEGLARLRVYVKREGHADLSTLHVEAGFPLGQWVYFRRSEYGRGRLFPERVRLLQGVPGWTWNTAEAAGRRRQRASDHGLAARVRMLRARLARRSVARSGSNLEGTRSLRTTIRAVRAAHRRGLLDERHVKSLESLPGWSWDVRQKAFQRGLDALQAFARREGHARVHFQHQEGNFNLGGWVAFKRRDYKYGRLDAAQVKALEAVRGWTWYGVPSKEDRFGRGLEALRRFVKRTGHSNVPSYHVEEHFLLGTWVARMRQAYRDQRIRIDRIAALERVPHWTWQNQRRGTRSYP